MFSKLPPEIIVAGIIIFGAIVHATAQFKVARENDVKHSLLDYIINLVIAAFSGMMFGLLGSLHFDNSSSLSTSTTPVLSWLVPNDITISTITCTAMSGGLDAVVQFDERTSINSAGTEVMAASGLSASSSAEAATSSIPNAGITAGNWLSMLIDGMDGDAGHSNPVCDVQYTIDD